MTASVQPAFKNRSGRVSGELHRRNQPAFKPYASDQPVLKKIAGPPVIYVSCPLSRSLLLFLPSRRRRPTQASTRRRSRRRRRPTAPPPAHRLNRHISPPRSSPSPLRRPRNSSAPPPARVAAAAAAPRPHRRTSLPRQAPPYSTPSSCSEPQPRAAATSAAPFHPVLARCSTFCLSRCFLSRRVRVPHTVSRDGSREEEG